MECHGQLLDLVHSLVKFLLLLLLQFNLVFSFGIIHNSHFWFTFMFATFICTHYNFYTVGSESNGIVRSGLWKKNNKMFHGSSLESDKELKEKRFKILYTIFYCSTIEFIYSEKKHSIFTTYLCSPFFRVVDRNLSQMIEFLKWNSVWFEFYFNLIWWFKKFSR